MWVMSSRRVLGGLEFFLGNVRIALIEWDDGRTYLTLPGHNRFECDNTSQAMRQMHEALRAPPPEDAEVSTMRRKINVKTNQE